MSRKIKRIYNAWFENMQNILDIFNQTGTGDGLYYSGGIFVTFSLSEEEQELMKIEFSPQEDMAAEFKPTDEIHLIIGLGGELKEIINFTTEERAEKVVETALDDWDISLFTPNERG